jgi:hypothetical protein
MEFQMNEVAQVVKGEVSQEQIRAKYEHDSLFGSLASKTHVQVDSVLSELRMPHVLHALVGVATCGEKSES